jgi:hypothetical protein
MKWTNDWIRDIEEPNREFLFLIANRNRAGEMKRQNKAVNPSGGSGVS